MASMYNLRYTIRTCRYRSVLRHRRLPSATDRQVGYVTTHCVQRHLHVHTHVSEQTLKQSTTV